MGSSPNPEDRNSYTVSQALIFSTHFSLWVDLSLAPKKRHYINQIAGRWCSHSPDHGDEQHPPFSMSPKAPHAQIRSCLFLMVSNTGLLSG